MFKEKTQNELKRTSDKNKYFKKTAGQR